MTEHNEALSPGERVAEGIWGRGYGELLRAIMNSFGPGFSDHIVSFFEHTYGREALDVKTRQICTLCGLSGPGARTRRRGYSPDQVGRKRPPTHPFRP
ncbi:MAG TPA: hypothetical protein ENN34_04875 [Deltaproteobacteria bacterium]|nr:hypothetical protein [Deltaproteobacteria bacterium]